MFAKPYKIKSTNTLKNVEKKQLLQRVLGQFSKATEENCKVLMPIKSTVIMMKLAVHGGETVEVYVVDGEPTFLEIHQRLFPTLHALWKVPGLIPTLVMHTPVLSKLQGGAQLYQPGVSMGAGGAGLPLFARGAALAACTTDNCAAAAVGRAPQDSAQLLLNVWSEYMLCMSLSRLEQLRSRNTKTLNGSCLEPVHVAGDMLCREPRFTRRDRPALGPAPPHPSLPTLPTTQPVSREKWPSLPPPPASSPVARRRSPPPAAPASAPPAVPAACLGDEDWPLPASPWRAPPSPTTPTCPPSPTSPTVPTVPAVPAVPPAGPPDDMDGLLRYCLLLFIKYDFKKVELPLKTNLLYRNYLVPLCPEDRVLDIKKSSYKKLSKFLEAMQQEGLITVREVERGVDALTDASPSHPAVREVPPLPLHPLPRATPSSSSPSSSAAVYRPPQVREMYCITAAVLDLFTQHKKGTPLTGAEIKSTLTEYVKGRELSHRGTVTMDQALARVTGTQEQETMKWEELMTCIQNKMTACTEMRFADGTVKLVKSRLEPIKMQVVTRCGNKKVTLVSNLESYGLSLPELSRSCQTAAAASCGVTRSPGAKADQLMLQGDQTYFIAKLLIEKYGFPKKYVEGADKALKKKNKN